MKEDIDYLKIEGMFAGASVDTRNFARRLRANMTPAENKLWEYLKTKPDGKKFRRQHPFSHYVLDFYCHGSRLGIEIDEGYHDRDQQLKKDEVRTENISKYKVKIIRFTNDQVINSFDAVIREIEACT